MTTGSGPVTGGGGSPPQKEYLVADLPDSLPGVDIPSGLARVAGNKSLYVKLLLRVAADVANVREKITSAIVAGDTVAVREAAHSLKGAAANLSIVDVAKAAEELETAAKAEDFSVLFTHLDALENALQRFSEAVSVLQN